MSRKGAVGHFKTAGKCGQSLPSNKHKTKPDLFIHGKILATHDCKTQNKTPADSLRKRHFLVVWAKNWTKFLWSIYSQSQTCVSCIAKLKCCVSCFTLATQPKMHFLPTEPTSWTETFCLIPQDSCTWTPLDKKPRPCKRLHEPKKRIGEAWGWRLSFFLMFPNTWSLVAPRNKLGLGPVDRLLMKLIVNLKDLCEYCAFGTQAMINQHVMKIISILSCLSHFWNSKHAYEYLNMSRFLTIKKSYVHPAFLWSLSWSLSSNKNFNNRKTEESSNIESNTLAGLDNLYSDFLGWAFVLPIPFENMTLTLEKGWFGVLDIYIQWAVVDETRKQRPCQWDRRTWLFAQNEPKMISGAKLWEFGLSRILGSGFQILGCRPFLSWIICCLTLFSVFWLFRRLQPCVMQRIFLV